MLQRLHRATLRRWRPTDGPAIQSIGSTTTRCFAALGRTSYSGGAAAAALSFDHCQFTAASPSPDVVLVGWPGRQQQEKQKQYYHFHQIRFRRHDRASAFSKPRPKTKKQRQAYNRRMKRRNDDEARWNPPGSKAGPRRQWAKDRWKQLLETNNNVDDRALLAAPLEDEDEDYTLDDALLEDLMGNTSHVTSQPTPEPVYLGHRHKQFYNQVANQMDVYREALDVQRQHRSTAETKAEAEAPGLVDTASLASLLPSDQNISLVMRAYRDRHGTRRHPIGIAAALKHLLQDLGVPTAALGENTYTTLLTCCRTPNEARRIFRLIHDHGHDVSAYAWSILVDVHAKTGDVQGCAMVLKEMAQEGGHSPTLAAYTSLLAACYKVCNDGRIPHAVRAYAGKVGWEHWQEMIIVGIEPDAMAYGAILRLCAARGLPERAIGLLEDMQRFQVKPTTLCFTAALKAVARSHETSIRFENGSSRKQLRREGIAAHHGTMARSIVIMAETAEVEQDDGFVAALMLCAAAAGDSATAKAVYLASEVRRMRHLRTIGSPVDNDEIRQQLVDGGRASALVDDSSTTALPPSNAPDLYPVQSNSTNRRQASVVPFGEREYGKDTRTISALMHASSQAMNKNGIGTIWAGRENLGYLCDNSLRLITTRWEPSYRDTSIPGMDSTKVGIGALRRLDDIERETEPKPGKRKRFRGLYVDDDAIMTTDDLEAQSNVEEDEDDDDDVNVTNTDDDDNEIFGPDDYDFEQEFTATTRTEDETVNIKGQSTPGYSEEEVFAKFVSDLKKEAAENGEEFDLTEAESREYFQMMKEEFLEEVTDIDGLVTTKDDEDFDAFLAELKQEGKESGEDFDLSNEEVRELFDMVQENDADEGNKLEETMLANENKDDIYDANANENDIAVTNTAEVPSEMILPTVPDSAIMNDSKVNSKLAGLSDSEIAKIEDLLVALPGLPVGRAKRILRTFNYSLGDPSLLSLVPPLRETMPDYVSSGWLKRTNTSNAKFAMQKASEDGLVDTSLLNAMLEVRASSGSVDEALACHADFSKHRLIPTAYSDRIVLQMLVANNRLSRALTFKQKIEAEGRKLDILSYGALVQYYSRHHQLGSSLMLLKECLSVHGSPPSEAYLSTLRVLCRQSDVESEVKLERMVGEDPIAWLKHGERFLKREKSKKGNRDIHRAYNRILG